MAAQWCCLHRISNSPVEVVQIDMVDAQPLARLFESCRHILGLAIRRAVGVADDAELSSEEDLVTLASALEPAETHMKIVVMRWVQSAWRTNFQ